MGAVKRRRGLPQIFGGSPTSRDIARHRKTKEAAQESARSFRATHPLVKDAGSLTPFRMTFHEDEMSFVKGS